MERNRSDFTPDQYISDLSRIEDLENLLNNQHVQINDFQKKLIDDSRNALLNALRTSMNRRFCLKESAYYFNGNFGYQCVYYRKPVANQVEVTFTVRLYTLLKTAFDEGRDLYAEIQGLIIPPAAGYSHESLIREYQARLAANESDKLLAVAASEELKLKKQRSKDQSNAIREARRLEEAAETDPAIILERAQNAVRLERTVKRLLEGERQTGEDYSSSEGDQEVEKEEEEEEETSTYPIRSILDEYSSGDLLGMSNLHLTTKSSSLSPQMPADEASASPHKHHRRSKGSNKTRGGRSSKDKISVVKSGTSTSKHRLKHHAVVKSSRNYVDKSGDSSTDSDLSGSDQELVSKGSKTKVFHSSLLSGPPPATTKSRPVLKSPLSTGSILQNNTNAFVDASVTKPPRDTGGSSSFLGEYSHSIVSSPRNEVIPSSIVNNLNGTVRPPVGDLPDFDGHPLENSLLHDIDETLTHAENLYDDEDEELGFEPHRATSDNVGWNDISSSKKKVGKPASNKKPRVIDPIKQKQLDDAASELAKKRADKLIESQAKRNDVVFQRRVLEMHNKQEVVEDVGDGDSGRKRRMTSGLSSHYENFYGENLVVNNQLIERKDSELISGTVDAVLGI
jgi:hypothetical protein